MNGRRAKKSLGQHFLVDSNLQKKIVAAVDPGPDDVVLEIGPGTGALTRHLVGRAGRVIAIEKDDALVLALQDEFAGRGLELVHADALTVPMAELLPGDRTGKIVGNIPYNITTPLIFRILETCRPAFAVLMVQREVADRIVATPGDKEYGALTVGIRTAAEVERLFHVGRKAFRPVPNVDSTVIRITPHDPPHLDGPAEVDLRSLTRAAFSMRRKQLQKILRTAPEYQLSSGRAEAVLHSVDIQPEARPETLAPDTFIALAAALRAEGLPARSVGDRPGQVPGTGAYDGR